MLIFNRKKEKKVFKINKKINIFSKYGIVHRKTRGMSFERVKFVYLDCVCAFDIETTRLSNNNSVMYSWQFSINSEYVIVGRTWQEYEEFLEYINFCLSVKTRLIVLVHNLAYEFQFLKGIFKFNSDDVFCLDSRKPLRALYKKIEYRCSYLHSNMSLKEYLKRFNAEFLKIDGDLFDYSKKRFSNTRLTELEYNYIINDVLDLPNAYRKEMLLDNDDVYTVPLTFTGYVRRDIKEEMKKLDRSYINKQLNSLEVIELLQECFRGGNTHANRFYSDEILEDVKSFDKSSSYPSVILYKKYPVTRFEESKDLSIENFMRLIYFKNMAVIVRVALLNVKLKNDKTGCPYLAKAKCHHIKEGVFDNGRILKCSECSTALTDVDFKIINNMYDFSMIIEKIFIAKKDYLPQVLRSKVLEYYRKKTELKNVRGKEHEYFRSKQKINSIYGMCVQNVLKDVIIFNGLDYSIKEDLTKEELLKRNNRKAFLNYAWGVYVTAYAREELQKAIDFVGNDFVYTDTDSVKFKGVHDFSILNREILKDCEKFNAIAYDVEKNAHYLGIFELDGVYKKFKTLGAKKYAYIDENDKLHITVSGVNKKIAPIELKNDIKNFKKGFIFHKAGGTTSYYNDIEYGKSILYTYKRKKLFIISNVCITDSTYKLDITEEYEKILSDEKYWLKMFDINNIL